MTPQTLDDLGLPAVVYLWSLLHAQHHRLALAPTAELSAELMQVLAAHQIVVLDSPGSPAGGYTTPIEGIRWRWIWQAYRADWIELRTPGAGRFAPDPMEGGNYAAFVLREVASTGWAVHCRIAVDAPAEEVLRRINPTVGVVETVDESHSVLVTGADSVEMIAVYIGLLGLDFHVTEPPELVEQIRAVGARYRNATPS